MKQSCVSAFARAARSFALAAVAFGFGAGSLLGQSSTGKIEGRVRDQAGAPIANAQVFLVGTAFNALTNPQGYYFLNNVPAGTYRVRAAFIGYKSTQVEGVKVLAGQTITVDIQLEQTAVQIEEITVVQQIQPLVPRDEVTTRQRIDGEVVQQLPVDRLSNIIALQPGVVASRGTGSLSVRGGRIDQNATYVDGVPVQAGFRGTGQGVFQDLTRGTGTQIEVGTDAFEQASVTTGATSAEFGNAQAGVISVETRNGSDQFSGTLSYENDFASGNSSLGFNRIGGGLGGPTGIKGLTFYVAAGVEGQRSIPTGKGTDELQLFSPAGIDTIVAVPSETGPTADTTFVPIRQFALATGDCDRYGSSVNTGIASNYGVDCQGARFPGTGRSSFQGSGKLNYTFGSGSRIAFSAMRSQFQGRLTGSDLNWSVFEYPRLTNPQNVSGFRNRNNVFTLNWTQNLSKSAERALALETYVSYQQDRTVVAPLTADGFKSSQDPFGGFMIGGLDFLWDFDNFPIDDELINNFRTAAPGGRTRPYPIDKLPDYDPIFQYRTNPYGMEPQNRSSVRPDAGFPMEEGGGPGGNGVESSLYRENRWIGRANLDWQLDRFNRVKFGGEFTKYILDYWAVELTSSFFADAYRERPFRWNAFVEDRLDLGDVVVVGGLRYDWYKSGASRPNGFPIISTHPDFDPANPTAQFVEDEAHSYLSPHVQVSFPVTDRTNFRLSYAHQVQAPDFGAILTGINTDVNTSNTNNLYGSDLDFGRTIAFEFGVRHAFSDDMVLDLAAYNRDVLSDAAGRLVTMFDPSSNNNRDIRLLTNADFGNTRGLDIRLDRRFGNFFSGTLAYTYQEAKNTGTDPLTYINFGSRIVTRIAGGTTPPPQAILNTNINRPHTLAFAGSVTFPDDFRQGSTVGTILRNTAIYATGRYTSGTAYSSCINTSENSVLLATDNANLVTPCSTGDFTSEVNGTRLPAFKALDMRFTKGFRVGGLDLTAYADVRNILNFTNTIRRYVGTNDVVNGVEFTADSNIAHTSLHNEARLNQILDDDNNIDLRFAGQGASGCGNWVTGGGLPGVPSCVYLVRVEQRFGDGNGIYTPAEQNRAFTAYYNTFRGRNFFTDAPRRMRLGLELSF